MIVVSDTSTLSGLLIINRFELLGKVYDEVIIPKAVFNELLVLENFGYDLTPVHEASWLKTAEPLNKDLEEKLKLVLDNGESAAIALAQELKPDYLAIDEKKGRKVAVSMGIPIIGLVGILILAKRFSLIDSVKPVMDELVELAGFRVNTKFYARILKEVGES